MSVGAINALVPILVIVILIGAAAGATRGFSFLDLFSIGTFMGMSPSKGAKASLAKSTFNRQLASTSDVRKLVRPYAVLYQQRKNKADTLKNDYKVAMGIGIGAAALSSAAENPTADARHTATLIKKKPNLFIRMATFTVKATALAPGVKGAPGGVKGIRQQIVNIAKAPFTHKPPEARTELEKQIAQHEDALKQPESRLAPFLPHIQNNLSSNLRPSQKRIEVLSKDRARELQTIKDKYAGMSDYKNKGADMQKEMATVEKTYFKRFTRINNQSAFSGRTKALSLEIKGTGRKPDYGGTNPGTYATKLGR